MSKVKNPEAMRTECIEFAKVHGIKWVSVGAASKEPFMKGWNKPEIYEPNQEEWENAFVHGKINLGFICGSASNGLVVVDFDSIELWKKLKRNFEGLTTVVKSGSGKIHVYLQIPNKRVATKRYHVGNVQYDIQAEGAQVVAPESIHPETGKRYEFIDKSPPMVWTGDIAYDMEQWVVDKFGIKVDSEIVDIEKLMKGVTAGNWDNAAIRIATFFRMNGKDKAEITQILRDWTGRCTPKEEPNEQWIREKIESAFRHEKPYAFKFTNTEIYSEATRKEAERLLDNPNEIIPYIREACSDNVGELDVKVLAPILIFGFQSIELSASYGSGKSHELDVAMDCLPKGWVTKITSLSSNALRYIEDDVQIRCLYITERRGLESSKESNVGYDMKVSKSEGFIRQWVPQKQEDGSIKTIEKTVRIGCFVTTTTEIAPNMEQASRDWNLCVNESLGHKRDVTNFQCHETTFLTDNETISSAATTKREAVRCLFSILEKETAKFKRIAIPYADVIAETLPLNSAGIFRHTTKLLTLVKVLTKMHYRKCIQYESTLISKPEIYFTAIELAQNQLMNQFMNLNDRQRVFWTKLHAYLIKQIEVSLNDISKELTTPYSTTKAYIDYLEESNLITSRMEGREKFVMLRKQTNETVAFVPASSKLLSDAYDNWLNSHPQTTQAPNSPKH